MWGVYVILGILATKNVPCGMGHGWDLGIFFTEPGVLPEPLETLEVFTPRGWA